MIRLLFENQDSICFMTLFSPPCIASIFLPIISILISWTKRTNFASWIFKGKSFMYKINKRGPRTRNTCRVLYIVHIILTVLLREGVLHTIYSCKNYNNNYHISRHIRRTFPPKKCDLNSTCVLCAEGKYSFQTYKYPYIYYTTSLSWDSEIPGSDLKVRLL